MPNVGISEQYVNDPQKSQLFTVLFSSVDCSALLEKQFDAY